MLNTVNLFNFETLFHEIQSRTTHLVTIVPIMLMYLWQHCTNNGEKMGNESTRALATQHPFNGIFLAQ